MASQPPKIEIGDEQRRRLGRLADANGRSASDLANEAIDEYCATRSHDRPDQNCESLYEAMTRTGSLGCVMDGPADLSTNPKHMEGFGKR